MANDERNFEKLSGWIQDLDNLDSSDSKELQNLIICSPFDHGVRANKGRPGSRFAPKAILGMLSQFVLPSTFFPNSSLDPLLAPLFIKNFNPNPHSTLKATPWDKKFFTPFKKIVQLGGGHENVFELLDYAASQLRSTSQLWVINIDAHCDTRQSTQGSEILHSGNPFRKFDESFKKRWNLIQIGIHPFSNNSHTLAKLTYGHMQIHFAYDWNSQDDFKKNDVLSIVKNLPIKPQDLVILSLDADAISSSEMPSVSAPNPLGLGIQNIFSLLNWYIHLKNSSQKLFGIYEMNPIYDNLSQKGARPLALLIYHYITTSI